MVYFLQVFHFLPLYSLDVCQIASVCSQWYSLSIGNWLWRSLCVRRLHRTPLLPARNDRYSPIILTMIKKSGMENMKEFYKKYSHVDVNGEWYVSFIHLAHLHFVPFSSFISLSSHLRVYCIKALPYVHVQLLLEQVTRPFPYGNLVFEDERAWTDGWSDQRSTRYFSSKFFLRISIVRFVVILFFLPLLDSEILLFYLSALTSCKGYSNGTVPDGTFSIHSFPVFLPFPRKFYPAQSLKGNRHSCH